jgi:TusA-related sulfurtransferase
MQQRVIEILLPMTLGRTQQQPIQLEQGTLLKVILTTPSSILVADDAQFNFVLATSDEDKYWRYF